MPTPNLSSPTDFTERMRRWGSGVLWVGLGGCLFIQAVVAATAPTFLWLLPVVLLGVGAWGFLLRRPLALLTAVLAGFAVIARAIEGIQLTEVLYGLFYGSYLAGWYVNRVVVRREHIVRTPLDRVVALLIVVGIGLGIVLGLVFGGELGAIRAEAQGFGMIAFYFPVKEACRRDERAPWLILAVIAWVGAYVAVSNFLIFREIMRSATAAWQIADARPGYNALQLMVPALGALAFIVSVKEWRWRSALLGIFLLCLAALILIKYRGFWVGFLFGSGVLFLLLRGRARWRLAWFALLGTTAVTVLTFTLFGDFARLIVFGVIDRFSTLGSATTKDISLINRLLESGVVWDLIRLNPILGYGFGVEFSYLTLIGHYTSVRTHIHNGYVGLWYKLGLWGTILGFLYLGLAAWYGFRVYMTRTLSPLLRVCGVFSAVCLIALLPTIGTENPFFALDQMYTIALLTGLAAGLYQRYVLPEPVLCPVPPREVGPDS